MLELSVCIGSSCHVKGSYNIIQSFQQMIEEHNLHNQIECKATFCMKQCLGDGVAISINDKSYHVSPTKA